MQQTQVAAASWAVADGTRGAVAARAATAADVSTRIAALESQLLLLTGKANRSERSKLNRELWLLQQQQSTAVSVAPAASSICVHVVNHWRVLHGAEADLTLLRRCIRCHDGNAATCRFHPDAKAFAFGTGRFEYGYTSAWDTPHDHFFCCGAATSSTCGCCEEPHHRIDADWWREYESRAQALDAEIGGSEQDEDGEEEEEEEEDEEDDSASAGASSEAAEALAAMEIG